MNLKETLEYFKANPDNKVVVIFGPTACWKTDLSIDIAKFLGTEIISTDSQQIFKGLDIWTWKITPEEMAWVKHHCLDIITPDISYSVWEFKQNAEKIIEELQWKAKVPMLVWGTGLYIDSLIFDFNIPRVPASDSLREELENYRLENWNEALHKMLEEIDPEYAKDLHPNNYRYVMRGIEVKKLTGSSKLEFREEKKLKKEVLFITPYSWNREGLYERINLRVKMMFSSGLVDEVKSLLEKYDREDFWMKSIWYKEVCSYLNEEISLEEAIELVQKHSRNYAKRQLTWFNKYWQHGKIFEGMSRLD